jgi:proline dehydrogenase
VISFDDTAIAFRSKNDRDLNRAYWLFKLIGSPLLVKIGKWFTVNALRFRLPIRGLIKSTIFQQFCGGENIQECTKTIESLASFGVGTILDYSIEGKTTEADFESTVEEIIRTIVAAENNNSIPFAVFKVTGIARFDVLEKMNDERADIGTNANSAFHGVFDRVNRICKAAHEKNVRVFIDAEESWIQDGIDRLTREMMRRYNRTEAIVYNTLQMYRHDRLHFLEMELSIAKQEGFYYGVKLVRGAYMEKERARAVKFNYTSPIQADKQATDHDFNAALQLLIDHRDQMALCAGTHNEASSLLLTELMLKCEVKPGDTRFYFAQLLGMSDHISYNLSNAGYNVAKYVPYGPVNEVMPYLLRRADENTSVAGQTGRELSLIMSERKRRKNAPKSHPLD